MDVGIRKVAVLGAGAMGSGIAAQVANAGVPVILLDMRREIAEQARLGLLERKPPALMDEASLALIESGGFAEDLQKIADCDWVVEAIVEQLEPKQALYRRLEEFRKPGSIVTSNTSGILRRDLVKGLPSAFGEDFLITHFFNPPRYMALLELVAGPDTRAAAVREMVRFGSVALGKEIVTARDTPCFIANRIGTMALVAGLRHAIELGLSVEQADALAGRPFGFPSTGVFGLFDLVGIDVFAHICRNLLDQLAPSDQAYEFLRLPQVVLGLLQKGRTGRKAGAGFYRISGSGRDKRREALDFNTGEYRPWQPPAGLPSLAQRELRELIEQPDAGGRFAWQLLSAILTYSAALIPEITDDIRAVDVAMREGYQWRQGPFQLLDQLGLDYFAGRLAREGRPLPALLKTMLDSGNHSFYREQDGMAQYLGADGSYRNPQDEADAWSVADLRRSRQKLFTNRSATLWPAAGEVAVLEFHSKMNAIDQYSIEAMFKARELLDGKARGLIIGSDAAHFSVGANLQTMLDAAVAGNWTFLEEFIGSFQQSLMGLKLAPFPVVGAHRGMALGGGCEVLLHCAALQSHAEAQIGLVEMRVGLLPAGGGCKEMLLRQSAYGRTAELAGAVERAVMLIADARVSTCAADARAMGILRSGDRVSMHARHLLADAEALVLTLASGYRPPQLASLTLPGAPGLAKLQDGFARLQAEGRLTAYDCQVANAFARVMTGGDSAPDRPVTEQELLDLEREMFVDLLHHRQTRERMAHMLQTGKPLRN